MKTLNIVLFILLSLTVISCKSEVSADYRLTEAELSKIRPGDIILRKGKSFTSNLITNLLNEQINISHCALIVELDSKLTVIQSISHRLTDDDGIQTQDLDEFISDCINDSVIVIRYKSSEQIKEQYIKKAFNLLEKKIPFDNDLKLNNGPNLYCSELFWEILPDNFRNEAAIFKLNRIIAFQSFLNKNIFSIILDHTQN